MHALRENALALALLGGRMRALDSALVAANRDVYVIHTCYVCHFVDAWCEGVHNTVLLHSASVLPSTSALDKRAKCTCAQQITRARHIARHPHRPPGCTVPEPPKILNLVLHAVYRLVCTDQAPMPDALLPATDTFIA